MSDYYVYILSNNSRQIYVGFTSELIRRFAEHRQHFYKGAFTTRYNFDRIVYFELHPTAQAAERRERRIKGWTRAKKVALIQACNPRWEDLSPSWGEALCLE